MLVEIARKVFGSRNSRLLKQYKKVVNVINSKEEELSKLTDDELRQRSQDLIKKVREEGQSLNDVLPDAFAVCREASKRVLEMRHFDVQLIGGIALHEGKIAEMKTGEGKTLVATLAVYLNALTGKGVHVVTVNDYLAGRDATTMGKLYNFLGLSVGVNHAGMSHEEKQKVYNCDITYGTNNEFGFDYLRDNMVLQLSDKVQRGQNYAVVDEVDSILIDEARTPLIISGQANEDISLYEVVDKIPEKLQRQEKEDSPGDFFVNEKERSIVWSEQGLEHIEQILTEMGLLPEGASLYSGQYLGYMKFMDTALKAHFLYFKDQQYVVKDGEIVIVDEFTGRTMEGRRWSDGLHQAIEAKEGVTINQENQTLASITFQNYFRLYDKLAGMTGTADTEAYEFQSTYGLETVIIPTNLPMIRKDLNDQIFLSMDEKFDAIVNDIKERNEKGQPILVGTTSIENSELISNLLNKQGLEHQVLNAKEHEREAHIVAQAGKEGMITVSTNMAGRGTDIVLGGNIIHDVQQVEEDESLSESEKEAKIKELREQWEKDHEKVISLGGLHIIGTERHESRRVDNQLRGRSGRQGDPGSSRFFLSFEDPLLRLFALDKAGNFISKLSKEKGVAIEHSFLTRQIEAAQRKVEGRNFDIRKQLLEYDDVANEQRKVIYHIRDNILEGQDVTEDLKIARESVISDLFDSYIPPMSMEEEWDVEGLQKAVTLEYGISDVDVPKWLEENKQISSEEIKERIISQMEKEYEEKTSLVGEETMREFERNVYLNVLDVLWREHLKRMDDLRQGIHLLGYGQKNPKNEFKKESFRMFQQLLADIDQQVTQYTVRVKVEKPEDAEVKQNTVTNVQAIHNSLGGDGGNGAKEPRKVVDENGNEVDLSPEGLAKMGVHIGRNDPCPCGSGLKYKHCHGKLK